MVRGQLIKSAVLGLTLLWLQSVACENIPASTISSYFPPPPPPPSSSPQPPSPVIPSTPHQQHIPPINPIVNHPPSFGPSPSPSSSSSSSSSSSPLSLSSAAPSPQSWPTPSHQHHPPHFHIAPTSSSPTSHAPTPSVSAREMLLNKKFNLTEADFERFVSSELHSSQSSSTSPSTSTSTSTSSSFSSSPPSHISSIESKMANWFSSECSDRSSLEIDFTKMDYERVLKQLEIDEALLSQTPRESLDYDSIDELVTNGKSALLGLEALLKAFHQQIPQCPSIIHAQNQFLLHRRQQDIVQHACHEFYAVGYHHSSSYYLLNRYANDTARLLPKLWNRVQECKCLWKGKPHALDICAPIQQFFEKQRTICENHVGEAHKTKVLVEKIEDILANKKCNVPAHYTLTTNPSLSPALHKSACNENYPAWTKQYCEHYKQVNDLD